MAPLEGPFLKPPSFAGQIFTGSDAVIEKKAQLEKGTQGQNGKPE